MSFLSVVNEYEICLLLSVPVDINRYRTIVTLLHPMNTSAVALT